MYPRILLNQQLMACSITVPRSLFLVFLLLAVAAGPVRARGSTAHLRFYMHDVTSGPDQTAVQLVKGSGPAHPLMPPGSCFGDTTVIDDLLTEGPSATSRPIGRAQGTYMLGDLKAPALMVAMTVLLTEGAYNGSTIAVMGRDDISMAVRELAVVGGTGQFRKAAGHVLWKTFDMAMPGHMVLQLDVYASVPTAAGTEGHINDLVMDSLA